VNEPIAWTQVEDALTRWVRLSTGFADTDVRLVPQRATGAARGPSPKVQISLLSMLQRSKVMRRRYVQTMRQRYTVTADGPGTVGVDFYPDVSLVPQSIAYVAGPGEDPASSAAGLLAELVANLPAGYSASADPEDAASVLVDGSDNEPVFAALPLDAGPGLDPITTVADAIPRVADLRLVQFRFVWRLDFRSDATNGASQASNARMRCQTLREDLLDPVMRSLGFESEGTAATTAAITPDRVESLAVYDVAFRGHMALAVARVVGRALAFNVTTQQAA
jgi:hypothetical protein